MTEVEKEMKSNYFFGNSIVIIIMCLFLGASIIPSISGNIRQTNTIHKETWNMALSNNRIIIVDNEGDGDAKTINDGIKMANNSDTILVYSGKYKENVVLNKSLTIIGKDTEYGERGQDTGKPIIDGDGTGNTVLVQSVCCCKNCFTISGFNITNSPNKNNAVDNNRETSPTIFKPASGSNLGFSFTEVGLFLTLLST